MQNGQQWREVCEPSRKNMAVWRRSRGWHSRTQSRPRTTQKKGTGHLDGRHGCRSCQQNVHKLNLSCRNTKSRPRTYSQTARKCALTYDINMPERKQDSHFGKHQTASDSYRFPPPPLKTLLELERDTSCARCKVFARNHSSTVLAGDLAGAQSLWWRDANPQPGGLGSTRRGDTHVPHTPTHTTHTTPPTLPHTHTTHTTHTHTHTHTTRVLSKRQNSQDWTEHQSHSELRAFPSHQLAKTPAISTKYVTIDYILLLVARKTLEF